MSSSFNAFNSFESEDLTSNNRDDAGWLVGSQAPSAGRSQNATTSGLPSDHPSAQFLNKFDDLVAHMDIPQYLTDNKTILRFPEKLLLLLVEAERVALKTGHSPEEACIVWTPNGEAIIVRNNKECLERLLALASTAGQFASFTRKLYRWGFRQVTTSPYDTLKKSEKVFWHPDFRRDNKLLTIRMKSTTAEGKRKAESSKAITALCSAQLRDPSPRQEASNTTFLRPLLLDQIPSASPSAMALPQPGSMQQLLQTTTPPSIPLTVGTDQLQLALLNSLNLIQQPSVAASRDLSEWNTVIWPTVSTRINDNPSMPPPATTQSSTLPSTLGADQLARLTSLRLVHPSLSPPQQDIAQRERAILNLNRSYNPFASAGNFLGPGSHSSSNDLSLVAQSGLLSELRQQVMLQALFGTPGDSLSDHSQPSEHDENRTQFR